MEKKDEQGNIHFQFLLRSVIGRKVPFWSWTKGHLSGMVSLLPAMIVLYNAGLRRKNSGVPKIRCAIGFVTTA